MRCNLCPRKCNIERNTATGFCGAGALPRVARADLHFWEEPCISGTNGSGAVFFSGCNMACQFCQNHVLQSGTLGQEMDVDTLAKIFLALQDRGAHNINLVTAAPHVPIVAAALRLAKKNGLNVPIVYNTNAYESVTALRLLDGLVDVYLPDLKYVSPALSALFSKTADYFDVAIPAITEMLRQVGHLQTNENGIAERGLMIRYLVLPGCVFDARNVLDATIANFSSSVHLSIMRQYAPTEYVVTESLRRFVTDREYESVLEYALSCGFSNILIQDKASANLQFVPLFTDSIWK